MTSTGSLRLGVRGKLFLISLALICATGAISSVYLEFELRRGLEQSLADELIHHAQAAAILLDTAPPGGERAALMQLSDAAEVRLTAIDPAGAVVDSAIANPPSTLADRPEIQAARATGTGRARMRQDQANPMLFVAFRATSGRIVRAGKPLLAVRQAIGRMRTLLAVAVALGLLVALFMSGLASYLFARPLKSLVDHARALAEDAPSPSPDLSVLNSSAHRLSTELETTIDELADERDRVEAVLEGITEAVFGLDAADRITFVNSAALRLLGRTDPRGAVLTDVIPELAGARRDEEGSLELALSDQRHFIARITDLRDGQIVTMLDVTRLRRLEQIRRDFVANVSHELRTPVSVIRANAETLRSGAVADPAQAEQFIDAMQRNAERLSEMIADLLNIARIEAGKYQVELRKTRVIEPAIIAYEQVEQLALDKDTTLDFELEEGLVAHADADALSHVLTNLLENAIKYTPPGSAVVLTGRCTGDGVRLEVRDDGPGIPAEHRPRVFERFYRIDAGRSKEAGGTGLGLAIVKHLVLAMGGQVGVEPNTPRGSIFWLSLRGAA